MRSAIESRNSESNSTGLAAVEAFRTIRRLGMDVGLWYLIPTVFLACYVGFFGQPSAAVPPHFLLVALPLLLLCLLRLLLQRLSPATWRRLLAAVLTAALLGALILYYALVLIGLRSWGGIVSWEVIPTFFAQTRILTDSMGLPLFVVPLAAALLYLLAVTACWIYLGRFDWIGPGTRAMSTPTLLAIAVGISSFVALQIHELSLGRWTSAGEPISLTLYPQKAALDLEGYSVNPVVASHLDQVADTARHAYVPATRGAKKKNLVVIIVDALRPDHLGVYGYGRHTTPHLATIMREHDTRIISGVHATCGDTICALFSLFSSKFTSEFSFRPFTLHEVLRRNGYRLHMLLSGDHTYFHSLKSIYGQVDTFYDGIQARARGYFLNDDQLLVDRLKRLPDWDGTPTMFQFHLMSAHILRKPDEVPGRFQPARRYALRNSTERSPRGEPAQTAVNFYDNGVLLADTIIDALLGQLQEKGYLHDTLVVITADHGESLGEHGLFTHANSVREELLRIPLLLIAYGYQPQATGPPRPIYSQVDIAPAILTDLALPSPSIWRGRSLQGEGCDPFSFFEEHAFAGLIDCRDPSHIWKYWIDRRTGADHVFDLSADPREEVDRSGAIPASLLSDLRSRTRAQTSAGLALN